MSDKPRTYWCVFCNRALPIDGGLIAHDDVPHDPLAVYEKMKTSDEGIAQIKQFEAFAGKPYRDVVGVLTWGYGHAQKGCDVIPATLTEPEACDLLADDLLRFELAVGSIEASLSQSEFDACVSLAFNIGVSAFLKSTVVKRLIADDYPGAAEAFLLWNKAGGNFVQGLANRREKEKALFLS